MPIKKFKSKVKKEAHRKKAEDGLLRFKHINIKSVLELEEKKIQDFIKKRNS